MNPKTYFLPLTAAACFILATAATAQTPAPTNAPTRATVPARAPADTTIITLPFTEDFESASINPAIWDQRTNRTATVEVVQDHVAHGKNALKVHYPMGGRSYAFIAARLPDSLHDHLYGRAYVYVDWLPQPHTVLMNAGTRGYPVSNFLEIGQYKGQFQPSVQIQRRDLGVKTGEKVAFEGDIPMGRWFCLEWELNDKPDKIVEWVDGKKVVDQAFTFNDTSSELIKGFSEFAIGIRTFAGAADLTNNIDIYYDDISISDKPIGQLTPVPAPAASAADAKPAAGN
jgi:hypothetical protein